jgi:hypothetical protein
MPNIDIPVPLDLKKLFDLPPCEELKLPLPEPIKVRLPTGGTLKAFADISKGIPNDCSMTFSLLLQIAPLLASMECLVKILKFLEAFLGAVKDLPNPLAIKKIVDAGEALLPCFAIPTPIPMKDFVKDILCLVLKVLKCVVGQLTSLIGILGPLTLQLNTAGSNASDNAILQCAKENAEITAQHLTKSIEPIGVILDLVGPLMGIVGVQPIKLPGIGSQTDLESLSQTVQVLQGVMGTIQIVVDTLGGCES